MQVKRKYIIRRLIGFLFLGVYVGLALLSTSVVQSWLGAMAGNYFSKEWGGKVRIGALHASPFSHVILKDIELIAPNNDTIYAGERISCRFKRFPYHDNRLAFDRVYLRNGRYHFLSHRNADGHVSINLQYIIDYYASEKPSTGPSKPFVVEVGELRLRNIDYIQDLPEPKSYAPHPGVDISHMRYLNTSAYFRKVKVVNDTVKCRIVSLTTTEASGLHVVDLSMDVDVSPKGIYADNLDLQTDDSRLFMDAHLTYDGWESMDDYCNNVQHDVYLKEGTDVNLREASWWAPALWGMDARVTVHGHVYGPVADMVADHLHVTFGDESRLDVDGRVSGLPYIDRTRFDVAVDNAHTCYEDLASVHHPDEMNVTVPDLFRQLGRMDFNASFVGDANDYEARFDVNTQVGDLEGNVDMQFDSARGEYVYIGDLDSRGIGIRALLPNQWVSRTGFHFAFQGVGIDPKTMEASLEGRLYNTQFKGHDFERASVSMELADGSPTVEVKMDDPMLALDLWAQVDVQRPMRLDLQATVGHAQLSALHLVEYDSALTLTTRLNASLQADSLENLEGSIHLAGTHCRLGSRRVSLDDLSVTLDESRGYKDLTMRCDWADVEARGYFRYKALPLLARDFCGRYLPVYYNRFSHGDSVNMDPLYSSSLDIDMRWKDAEGSIGQVIPQFYLAEGATLYGSYNYGDALKLVVQADSVRKGGLAMHDVGISSGVQGDTYKLRLHAASLAVGATSLMENLNLTADMGGTISMLALNWSDSKAKVQNEGDLEFFLTSTPEDNRLMITKPSFYLMGQRWNLVCPDGIRFNDHRLAVNDLKVYGLGQSLSVRAAIEDNDDDYLKLSFSDYAVGEAVSLLLANKSVDMKGTLDGDIRLLGLNKVPYVDADLMVDNCEFNGEPLGNIDIHSHYKKDGSRLQLDLVADRHVAGRSRYPVEAHGGVDILSADKKMVFDVALADVSLTLAEPFLQGVSSDMAGSMDGTLTVSGSLNSPLVDGSVAVSNGALQLAATGVRYSFQDTLTVSHNRLSIDNFAIYDPQMNKALVNGDVDWGKQGLMLDLAFRTNRISVLDKVLDNSPFYGKLLASARGTVAGPANKLDILVDASVLDGSEIFVPISNKKQVSENEYIVFVAPAAERSNRVTPSRTALVANSHPKMNLLLNLHVTPGMKLHLPMDFQQLEANVTAVGQGDIQLSMNDGKQPNVLGNYEFTSGNFTLTLISLISKTFAIEEGSTLNFPGSLDEARFNINAVYNLRANLATLVGPGSTASISDGYVPVQDVIMLSGTLSDPTVKFDIRLPNAEQSVTDQVFSYIDKNNERDLLNQSVSLLVMGRFAAVGMGSTESGGTEGGINGIGLLTSSVGSLVSSMVKVVDVNFNYQTGITSQASQFDVGISKQWNKLYFESSFGYGTNSELDAVLGNVLVGDVEMGYKFTPYFNFYGFQRTNTSYFTRTELPYKQGLGVKLSKDFDSWSELFLRKRKKRSATEAKPY